MILKQELSSLKKTIHPETLAIGVLTILYLVGIVGVALPFHPDFVLLTPLNLLISLIIMLMFHDEWNQRIIIFLFTSYLVGFGAELFGVQTGFLFGDYQYGHVLGPKIWGTPLMIGVNWMILAYASGTIANTVLNNLHWLLRAVFAALLMVGLDVLIEPVAMRLGFWSWAGDTVPLQNYIGWFLVALPLLCIFTITLKSVRNKVAIALFILQFIFFLSLNIL